ncbi:MAG: C25 family cysteine peptidase [Thermoplasmatota archaeon]
MAPEMNRKLIVKIGAAAVVVILVIGVVMLFALRAEEEREEEYSPDTELPEDFMVIVDNPSSEEDLLAIAALTPLLYLGGDYHPLVIIEEDGDLSPQLLFTLTNLETDREKLIFSNREDTFAKVNAQLGNSGLSEAAEGMLFPLTTDVCSRFVGFDGIMTVGSYEEALWAAPIAKMDNKAMVFGETTFQYQEQAWAYMAGIGINADYIIAANPNDHSVETLSNRTVDYDTYDNAWFCPDLSVHAAQMAAYHDAYVITRITPQENVDWEMNMEFSQNRRAAGYLQRIRDVSREFGPAEYVTLVGSASAIPQFLMQINGQGAVTNSDIMYGFLDDDQHSMDAAVGRLIQYEESLASNQLLKTYLFDDFSDTVEVNYRDVAGGTHQKDWRTHGASFSGYDITYKRMQATPGRWICTDYEDAGFTYDYVGPFGTGQKFMDGVVNSMENSLMEICQGSGYVAYRGHGSDTGSLYGIRVYGPNGEEYMLSAETAATMDLPPQVAFFVSCLNGKIYGNGPGTDPGSDTDFSRLFTLNYLSAGPAVLVGATEVSYSNIGQDLTTLPAEYLPFSDDHKWDHNDAWYAFVWDGILNHPGEHGTIGKAVQWSENRYIRYPPNNSPSPFTPADEVDWYEVTFFSVYGDPAFRPAIPEDAQPGYDPWHNGEDDI